MVALRGVCAYADDRLERLALAALEHHRPYDARHLAFGHAGPELARRVAPYLVVEPHGRAHLLDFARRLHRAALGEIARDILELRAGEELLELFKLGDGYRLLEADFARRGALSAPEPLEVWPKMLYVADL